MPALTTVAVAVRVSAGEPPVPVTVKGYDPATVVELTVTVSVEEVPEDGLGLKAPVAPAGRPLTDRLTAAVTPPVRLMLTVYVAVPPVAGSETEDGLIERLKSGEAGAVTTNVAVAVRVREPLVPVVVNT